MGKRVRVAAPASTANLGPGFDCLGLALELYHRLEVTEEPGEGAEVLAWGEGARTVPLDDGNLVLRGVRRALDAVGYTAGFLRLESRNEIPLACGLGSSAAAYAAGLAAGQLLCGRGLERDSLIEMGVEEEGHADNVTASVLGGFVVVGASTDRLAYVRLEPPGDLQVIAAVPDFALPTRESRAVLPKVVPFDQAVLNQGRVGLLVAALTEDRPELIGAAMEDCLHQPYRAALVPGMDDVRQAALGAGALGAALSGAGPTILALVRRGAEGVGEAMRDTWARHGVQSRVLALEIDRSGLWGEDR